MFFAALALSRFADVPSQRISAGANIPWGNNLEAAARADDKLIFVYRAGEKFSPQVQKQIFENYIAAEFDPQRWPADNEIFGSIISGGGDRAMLFGILTPRLVPLFLTSKRDVVIDGKKVDLAALLSTTSDFYRQNRLRVYETARIVEREKLASATVPASGKATAGGVAGRGIKAESDAVSKFLSGASAPASANAVFSESVRLGVELHKKIPSPELGSSLSAAAKILSENIADRARKFCARLLCARALSEYAQQFADGDAKNVLAAFADEVLAQQHSNGFLYGPADKFPTLRANAIGAGFLIRASKVLARPDCLKAAVIVSDRLARLADTPADLPAAVNFDGESMASSAEYALLIGALIDMCDATQNARYLEAAKRVLGKWDENCMAADGVWSVNSRNSRFFGNGRLVTMQDGSVPCYIGEGLQALRKLKRLDGAFNLSAYSRLVDFAAGLRNSDCGDVPLCPSVKLAEFQ